MTGGAGGEGGAQGGPAGEGGGGRGETNREVTVATRRVAVPSSLTSSLRSPTPASEPPSSRYAVASRAPKSASSSSTDAIRLPCASSVAESASVIAWLSSALSCPIAYATRGYAAPAPTRACSWACITRTRAWRIGRISAAVQTAEGTSAASVPSAASSSAACCIAASHSAAQFAAMYSA